MRRLIGLAAILILLWLVFQRKDEAASSESHDASAAESGSSGLAGSSQGARAGSGKPTKASQRPETPGKRIPIAEPVPEKPGYVKSPFSGRQLYIGSIPAGRLVGDPYSGDEEDIRAFRIPEGASEPPPATVSEDDEFLRRMKAAEGEPVPGKPGFIFDPYDQSEIDITGLTPGAIIMARGSIHGASRYIKVPGGRSMSGEE